jgi:hypothetical protein
MTKENLEMIFDELFPNDENIYLIPNKSKSELQETIIQFNREHSEERKEVYQNWELNNRYK